MAAKYPVGIQTFDKIISEGMAYVDKTALVYKLANGTQNNFLSRPRRFGKSLLVTTLQAYFESRKELFKGLAIEQLEKNWVKYPVIHLDMSRGKYYSIKNLHGVLNMILGICEEEYNIVPTDFQAILYTVFEVLNFTISAEARTANGRVDILVQTKKTIFVMELKMDKPADEALAQIDDKQYALPWKHDGRRLFKVGISFSTKEKNVTEWKYVEEK